MALGGAAKISFIIAVVIGAISLSVAMAVQHTVGDDLGWTVGVDYVTWASSRQFHVGDTLVFSYTKGAHDVTEVDAASYTECAEVPPDSSIWMTGGDTVKLTTPGQRWFMCGIASHCESGQKLAITVE